MAANKFATTMHHNTNKITLILMYAVLEWTLIILLLLHSVFTYFIVKFAQFFGLNPPCFWCARIDRFFDPQNNNFGYNLCDLHSKEVSSLKFCSMHQKMVKSHHDLCDECSSSDLGFRRESTNFVFSKVQRIVMVHSDGEDEVNLKCSCCGVNFERKFVDDSSCFVIHPFWDIFGDIKKGNSVDDHAFKIVSDDHIESDCVEENEKEKEELETEDPEIELIRESNSSQQYLIQFEQGDEDLNSHDLQFFIDYSGNQLFPFELPDSKTEENQHEPEDEDHEFGDFQKAKVNPQHCYDSVHLKTEESHIFDENLIDFDKELDAIDQETQNPSTETKELEEDGSDVHSVHEEEDVSIGTEIPVLDSCDEIKHEEPSANSNNLPLDLDNDIKEANAGELKNMSRNMDESEEEKAPETPSSMYSLNPLHKKWLTSEAKDSGAEESFDGSVTSEMGGDDPINTAEKLKLALKAERKALRDLYMELEEERNASAVAANETMAMINRLQEEKAAMQMEALQYQRMMEEQSEYDQEALQLLNELMMKKEKELELYRKKVADHETKEKSRTGTSSVSWSHSEDDDGSSIDLNQAPKQEEFINLESSLADFEEERVSILEQLKFLEEKLFALSDEEDRHFANIRVIEDHYEETGNYNINGQAVMGKQRLLPVFEEVSTRIEDGVTVRNGYENGFHSSGIEDTAVARFELEKKRIDMEEEVDQLYGRLQALEADREFLKHCIGSMKKGDKGLELVQEILHHLRHLRNVNLRAKNYTHNALL